MTTSFGTRTDMLLDDLAGPATQCFAGLQRRFAQLRDQVGR